MAAASVVGAGASVEGVASAVSGAASGASTTGATTGSSAAGAAGELVADMAGCAVSGRGLQRDVRKNDKFTAATVNLRSSVVGGRLAGAI